MICLVTGPNDEKRLVRAKSKNAAVDYVVAQAYTVKAVGADEAMDLRDSGLKLEEAVDQVEPAAAEPVAGDTTENAGE